MNQQPSRRQILTGMGAAVAAGVSGIGSAPQARADEPKAEKPFRFCLNTSTIRGQKIPLLQEIDIASQAGYDAMEPWMSEIDLYAKGGGNLKDLGKTIADKNLTVDSVIGFYEFLSEDDAKRNAAVEKLKHDLDMLAQMGAKRMACPPVGVTDRSDIPTAKLAERYRAILEIGDKIGVIPELELWGFSKTLGRLGQGMDVIIETNHPKACLLLDVFHLAKGHQPFGSIRTINGALITCFHMNDFPGDQEIDKLNDSHRIYPGDGAAPLTQLFKDLRASGFKGVLSLELFNKDEWKRDGLTVAKLGLEKLKAAVQKSLA